MNYFDYLDQEQKQQMFFIAPAEKLTDLDKNTMAHALGATLYMPGDAGHAINNLISGQIPGLISAVLCLEDAVDDRKLADAEANLAPQLASLLAQKEQGLSLPFIFIRVRHLEQLKRLTSRLGETMEVLTGFVFPKFDLTNGAAYFEYLRQINKQTAKTLYGMPILEGPPVIHLESRAGCLLEIKQLLDQYHDLVLNVRMGATDLSGLYGLRRSPELTIYDISVIRDFIADLVNVFGRPEDHYVISGPVWEYFGTNTRMLKPQLSQTPFREQFGLDGYRVRLELLDRYIDGLLREVMLDKANGLVGKTVIHPSHILPVQAMYAVTHEEYCDAKDVLANNGNGGVTKSVYDNKMNEAKPHSHWARRIMTRAKIYGVLHEKYDYTSLIYEGEKLQQEYFTGEQELQNIR